MDNTDLALQIAEMNSKLDEIQYRLRQMDLLLLNLIQEANKPMTLG
jgi:hypothetical protein